MLDGGLEFGGAKTGHVHIAFGAPGLAGDVAEPGRDQQQGAVAIRKGAYDAGPTPDLAHDAFERIVGA